VSNLKPSVVGASGKEWTDESGAKHRALASCPYFTTELITSTGRAAVHAGTESFVSLVILEGQGAVENGEDRLSFATGDSLFVSAGSGAIQIKGECTFIKTTV
ncbi:MAG: hypothetical protein VB081_07640, partial [Christensenella sp.]|nr:hypothetical protein [Christensenella sp.]